MAVKQDCDRISNWNFELPPISSEENSFGDKEQYARMCV